MNVEVFGGIAEDVMGIGWTADRYHDAMKRHRRAMPLCIVRPLEASIRKLMPNPSVETRRSRHGGRALAEIIPDRLGQPCAFDLKEAQTCAEVRNSASTNQHCTTTDPNRDAPSEISWRRLPLVG